MSFLYQRSRFKLDIWSSPENWELTSFKVFFNPQFNRLGNPNASIENFSRFGRSYTADLTVHTRNVKKNVNHYLLIMYLIIWKKWYR